MMIILMHKNTLKHIEMLIFNLLIILINYYNLCLKCQQNFLIKHKEHYQTF